MRSVTLRYVRCGWGARRPAAKARPMRVFAVLAVALWGALPTVAGASEVTLRGFTAAASAQERRKDEARFLAVPSAGGAVATSRT